MFRKQIVGLIILSAFLFAPLNVARAQTPNAGDIFLFGQNYTLSSAQTLNGSIVLIGGNITIEKDAQVNGDIVLIGGNLNIAGSVNGEIAVIGGTLSLTHKIVGDIALIGSNANLSETAIVKGNITTMGGRVDQNPKAEVDGQIVNNAPPDIEQLSEPRVDVIVNPFGEIFSVMLKALGMAIVALLLTLFLDAPIKRVGDYALAQPFVAASVGLLAIFISTLLFWTILPIFVIFCAWVLGVVAIGQEVGRRFVQAINQSWQPIFSTAFGTFLLVLVVGFAGLIPCIGWVFKFALALVGIGSVMMTRFGAHSGSAPTAVQGTPAG